MPLEEPGCPVYDLIMDIHLHASCHGKVILPGGKHLADAVIDAVILSFLLTGQVIPDLHIAHPVFHEIQILRQDIILDKPADEFVW